MTWYIRRAVESDAEAIAQVHVDTWRTAYAGVMSADFLGQLSYDERTGLWRRLIDAGDSSIMVAIDDSEIVGFASGGEDRDALDPEAAELYSIYVRADRHRRGIGRALMAAVADELAQREFRKLRLWVLEENETGGDFYRSLGGVATDRKIMNVGGADLDKVAYDWEDLTVLLPPD